MCIVFICSQLRTYTIVISIRRTSEIPQDLLELAIDMMQGDKSAAISWFSTPLEIIGNVTPLDYLNTTNNGVLEIKTIIGRIRHGVFT